MSLAQLIDKAKGGKISFTKMTANLEIFATLAKKDVNFTVYIKQTYDKETRTFHDTVLNNIGNSLLSAIIDIDVDALSNREAKPYCAERVAYVILENLAVEDESLFTVI